MAQVVTTKTEFLRYLNEHEADVPPLKALAILYRKENPTRHTFGMWLHARHIKPFQLAYTRWWIKHPKLWGVIYEEVSAR